MALIAFTLFRFVGDPVNQMVGIDTPPASAQLREQLGLNDPIPVQFGRFVGNAARLDFGNSYQFRQPVLEPARRPLAGDDRAGLRAACSL